MANSDPQSKRKRTWGEFLFGDESSAVKKAEYKRGMGIDPANKRIQNVEAAASAKSMDNPTSVPPKKLNAEQRVTMDQMAKKRRKESGENRFATSANNPINKAKTFRDMIPSITTRYPVSADKKTAAEAPQSKPPVPKAKPAGGSSSSKKAGQKTAQKAVQSVAPKKTGDKSRLNSFERMKQRQYEKEGYGGRAMTAAQARARVEKERGSKVSVPGFSKVKEALKGAASKVQGAAKKPAAKPVTKMAKPEYKSQKARDFAAKMQGRNRSVKVDSKFKFKDLFK